MGGLLPKPVTHKETEEGKGKGLVYGVASMQGWRISQEDAHLAVLANDTRSISMFGVFDGHGGHEVSRSCALHIPDMFQKEMEANKGDINKAIASTFLGMDEYLRSEEGQAELDEIASQEPLLNGSEDGEGLTVDEMAVQRREQVQSFVRGLLVSSPTAQALMSGQLLPEEDSDEEEEEGEEGEEGDSENANANKEDGEESGEGEEEQGEEGEEEEEEAELSEMDEEEREQMWKEMQQDTGPGFESGCTAVVALIVDKKRIIVANAGDSRAVLCRKGGKAEDMSRDQGPEDPIEKARIEAAGGAVLEGRIEGNLNVARAIGDMQYKTNKDIPQTDQMITANPEIKEFAINKGDEFMIIACDGIWGTLTSQQAVDFVRERRSKALSLVDIASEMCDHVISNDPEEREGEGCDNMTVMIVALDGKGEIGVSKAQEKVVEASKEEKVTNAESKNAPAEPQNKKKRSRSDAQESPAEAKDKKKRSRSSTKATKGDEPAEPKGKKKRSGTNEKGQKRTRKR